jgi:hypothetical protein
MINNTQCFQRFFTKNWKFLSRNLKTKDEPSKIKFTETINLPKTKFPARLNPKQKEEVEKAVRSVSQIESCNCRKVIKLIFISLRQIWIRFINGKENT